MEPESSGSDGLLQAMPKPLLVVFVALALVAVVAAVALLIRPPSFESVALEARRPPPAGPFSHDPLRVRPIVLPGTPVAFRAPCPDVEGVKVQAGTLGVARLTRALAHVCELAGPASPDTQAAIRALRAATIRFAAFDRSGTESTLEVPARTIWLNVKFSERELPVTHLVPVLLHDAFHLSHMGLRNDARAELAARRVEADACRQLVTQDEPRWCSDARAIAALPAERAFELLKRAGFTR